MHILFVDSSVNNYQNLIAAAKPGTEVVVLDSTRDGVEQITEVLSQKQNVETVEIISHGGEGMVQLGGGVLSNGNLQEYRSQLQQWKEALTEDADILFYGCNVAAGENGVEFVRQLSELTGADIAASEDLTGNSDLEGDWDLEVVTGEIEAETAISLEAQESFAEILSTKTGLGYGLKAEYFNNRNLSGSPVYTQIDKAINFDWGEKSPVEGKVNQDNFSVRWTGNIIIPEDGYYQFSAEIDDSVLLYINNQQVIKRDKFEDSLAFSDKLNFKKGQAVPIKLDYSEVVGNAKAKLFWEATEEKNGEIKIVNRTVIPETSLIPYDLNNGLKGQYFNNKNLSGSPALTQIDNEINFDWGEKSPLEGTVDKDNFSIRWKGSIIIPEDGWYKFSTEIDDSILLYIDNKEEIEREKYENKIDESKALNFKKGQAVPIKLDYSEVVGNAKAKLFWEATEEENGGNKIINRTLIPETSLFPYDLNNGLKGEYFNNKNLSGSPALTQIDNEINFDWGEKSPLEGTVDKDNFSIRWKGSIIIPEDGWYKFSTEIDDSILLYIDNQEEIKREKYENKIDESKALYFKKGQAVPIKLDYTENVGPAKAKLFWEATEEENGGNKIVDRTVIPETSLFPYDLSNGLKGQYFNNEDFSGSPVITQIDNEINFDWGLESPLESIVNKDYFTVRWTGSIIIPEDGKYKFSTEIDDRTRLWIDNQRVIDRWFNTGTLESSDELEFKKGQAVPIKLEYADDTLNAKAKLFWEATNNSGDKIFDRTIIPETSLKPYEPFVSIEKLQEPIEGKQHGQFKIVFDKKPPEDFKLYLDLPQIDQSAEGKATRGTLSGTQPGSDYKLYYRYKLEDETEKKDFSENFIKIEPNKLQEDRNGKYSLTIIAEVVNDYLYEDKNNENITISLRDNFENLNNGYSVNNSKRTVTLQIQDNEPTVSFGNVVNPSEGFDDGSTLVNLESALKFTGNNSVTVPANDSLNLNQTGQFTQEAWIFPTVDDNNEYGILGYGNNNQSYPGIWLYDETGIKAGFGDGESWNNFTVENVINQNQWNHVATSFDGNEYRLYVNGNLVYTTLDFTGKKPAQTQQLTIGDVNGNKFQGQIDEVRLWNVARSYEQIQGNVIETLKGNEEGLVGYWQFDKNTNDSSTNQNNGTLQGGANNSEDNYIYNPLPQIGYVEINLDKEVDNAIGLWVRYNLSGNATQGTDYFNSQVRRSTGEKPFDAIIIPNQKQAGRIYFTASPDAIKEGDEQIQINLTPYNFDGKNPDGSYGVIGDAKNSNYAIDSGNQSKTITIKDNNAYQPGIVIKDQFERVVNQANPVQAQAIAVYTNVPGEITVSSINSPSAEQKEKAFDNSSGTKWLIFEDKGWIQYQFNDEQPRLVKEYLITSANDEPNRDPKNWTLQGSNDGTTWTDVDKRTNEVFDERFQTKAFKVSSNQRTPFQYYRLNVEANNGGRELQLAEFQLLGNGSNQSLFDLTNLVGTAIASNNNSPLPEGKEKAFDDKSSTKWLIFDNEGYLQYKFDNTNGYIVNQYTITSANDKPNRDPKDWVLEASKDGENWKELDTRSNENFPERFQTRNFVVTNEKPYQYYRLNVKANSGASELQFAELQLIGPNIDTVVEKSEKNFDITFQLSSQPNNDVTVELTNLGELTASQSKFTIKPEDWDKPQLINVEGITADGKINARLTSADADYNKTLDIPFTAKDKLPTLQVTEGDPREKEIIPLVRITPVDKTINEGANQNGQFLIELSDAAPEDGLTVVYNITGSGDRNVDYKLLDDNNIGELKIAPGETTGSISFNIIDDNIDETKESVAINLSQRNGYILDSTYKSAAIDIEDNDTAGIDIVNVNTYINEQGETEEVFAQTLTSLTTSEDGTKAVIAVRLNSQPEKDVTVSFDDINDAESQFDKKFLRFTKDNWNQYQKVTITGVDDDVKDGDVNYQVTVKISSDDPFYRGIGTNVVNIINRDNDSNFISVKELNDPNLSEEERQQIIDAATKKLEEQTEAEVKEELDQDVDLDFTKVETSGPQASLSISNSDEIKIDNNSLKVEDIPLRLEDGTPLKLADGSFAEIKNSTLLQLKKDIVFKVKDNYFLEINNVNSLQFIDGNALKVADEETPQLAVNTLHKIGSGTVFRQDETIVKFKNNNFIKLEEGESVELDDGIILEEEDGTLIEKRNDGFWKLGAEESVQLQNENIFKQDNGTLLKYKNNTFLKLEQSESVQLQNGTELQPVYSTPLQLNDDKALQLADGSFLQLESGNFLKQKDNNALIKIAEGTSLQLDGASLKTENSTNPLKLTVNLDKPASEDIIVRYGVVDGTAIEDVDYKITGGTFALLRQIGKTNPLNGFDVGENSSIDFAYFNSDGLIDALAVGTNGTINYYQNNGNQFSPLFIPKIGKENPFDGIKITDGVISIADLNNDGIPDVVLGTTDGTIKYYQKNTNENTGSQSTLQFTPQIDVNNPFNGIDVGDKSQPVLTDINGDDLIDLVVHAQNQGIKYYQNTGSKEKPIFTEQTGNANPFITLNGSPAFADLDKDGDLDLILGVADNKLRYYQNNNGFFIEQTGSNNPFNQQNSSDNTFNYFSFQNARPTFVDLDNDKHQDLIVGKADGTFTSFTNLPGVKILKGQTSASLEIAPIEDEVDENVENIKLRLLAGANYQLNPDAPDSFTTEISLADDNDTAGVTINPLQTETETSETGDFLNYELKLNSQPVAPVTVYVGANKPGEAKISFQPPIKNQPESELADFLALEFTPENWNISQKFTVVGVDDRIDDGGEDNKIPYQLLTTVESQDLKYHKFKVAPIDLINIDDDLGGVNINLRGDAGKLEEGTTNVFTVTLKSQPTDEVNVTVIPGDDQIVLNGQKPRREVVLTFDEKNWDKEQVVRVVAVDDGLVEYDHQSQVSFKVESEKDPVYNNSELIPEPLTVNIRDNDLPTAKVVPGWTASELEGKPSGFMVYLSHNAPNREGDNGIKVNYEIVGGSATYDTDTSKADYQPIDKKGSVTIAPGDIQNNILIVPIDDKLVEKFSLDVDGVGTLNTDGTVNLTLSPTKPIETVLTDNFDNGVNSEQLSTENVIVNNSFQNTDGKSLFFTGEGTRQAVTKTLDVSNVGTVSFDLIFSDGSNGGEKADEGEDVVLEYSTDGGQNFTVLKTYDTQEYTSWTTIKETIPQEAQTQKTQFRWRQVTNTANQTNPGYDNWGLDNINISAIKSLQLVKGSKIKLADGLSAEVTEDVTLNNETANVKVKVKPEDKDKIDQIKVGSIAEVAEETVQIKLLPGEGYELGSDKTEATLGIIDDDEPGVRIIEFGDHTTVIEGQTATFQISLLSEPTEDVTITINDSGGQVRALNSELTFTPQNWYKLQEVTVEGIDEAVAEDGDFHTTFLKYQVNSSDDTYNNFAVADQQINVIDRLIDKQEAIKGVTEGLRSSSEILNNLQLPLIGSPEGKVPSITEGLDKEVAEAIDGTDNLTAKKLKTILEKALHNFEISLLDFGIDKIIRPFKGVEVGVEMTSDDLNVTFEVSDKYNLFDFSLDADLGLPALGLETEGSISSFFEYTFGLGLGFHKEFGFYIDTEKTKFEADIAAILGEGDYDTDDDGNYYFQPNSNKDDSEDKKDDSNKLINELQSDGEFSFLKKTYWDKNNNGKIDSKDEEITDNQEILDFDRNDNKKLDATNEGSYGTDDKGYYFQSKLNSDKKYYNQSQSEGEFAFLEKTYWDKNNNGRIDLNIDKDITEDDILKFDLNGNGKLDGNLEAKANLWLLQFDVNNDSNNPSKLDIGFNVNLADDLTRKINFVDIDGDGNLDFSDKNNNGIWDEGEPFTEPTGKVKNVEGNDAEGKKTTVKKLLFNSSDSVHKQYENDSSKVETDSQGTKLFKGEVKTFEEEPIEVFLDINFNGQHDAKEPIGPGVKKGDEYILEYDSTNKKHKAADKNNDGKFDVEIAANDPGHGKYVQDGNIRFFDFNLNNELDYYEPSTFAKGLKEFQITKFSPADNPDSTFYYFDSDNNQEDKSDYRLIQEEDTVRNQTNWYFDLNNDTEGQSYEKLDEQTVEHISKLAKENEGDFTLKDYTTQLEGTFVTEDDGDRLTASEIVKLFKDPNIGFKDLINYNLGGEANLGLEMKASIEGDAAIPSIGTNLAVNYPIFNYGNQKEAEEQKFSLAFNDITLDLGSFITDFAKPIFDSLNDLFEPLRPVIDVLNTDTQVLIKILPEYDKNKKTGNDDGKLTLLEFFAGAANDEDIKPLLEPLLKEKGLTYERFQKSIGTAKKIIDLFTKVDEVVQEIAAFEAGENITIDLGSYSLDDIKGASKDSANSTAGNSELEEGNNNSPNLAANSTAESQPESLEEQAKDTKSGSFLDKLSNIEGLEFQLLNPLTILRILLGEKNVDLFTFDVPDLELLVPFTTGDINLGIVPPGITVTGQFDAEFGASTDLFVGFDTGGLELWSESDFALGDAYKVFDGFYLRDGIDENGDGILQPDEDSNEFSINAKAELALSASAWIAKLTGYGGLEGTAGLDMVDGGERNGTNDGKIRFSELGEKLSKAFSGKLGNNVGSILTEFINLTGKLEAYFGIKVKTGFTIFGKEIMTTVYEDELGRATIFDFNLADLVSDTVVKSNDVTPTTVGSANTVAVDANTVAENADIQSNSNDIARLGSVSTDAINSEIPDTDNQIDTEESIATSKNQIAMLPTKGNDVIEGTLDNDFVNADNGDDIINGKTGDDQLLGGKGNDTLVGGEGNDNLEGNFGDDSLKGDLGNDLLEGGAGNDTIYGGTDNDRISGDAGNDNLFGDNGADNISGGSGNDNLTGGFGNDVLVGDRGDDMLTGGAGDDVLTGGAGKDTFVFSSLQHGYDKITDFDLNEDKIFVDLQALGISDLDANDALSYNSKGILLYNDTELALIENKGLLLEEFSINQHIQFS